MKHITKPRLEHLFNLIEKGITMANDQLNAQNLKQAITREKTKLARQEAAIATTKSFISLLEQELEKPYQKTNTK